MSTTTENKSGITTVKVEVFKRFERFWHWSQMALIFILVISGFGVHGVHNLMPFSKMVDTHTFAALVLLVIWIFATFWLFTTGQWKHYLPTTKNMAKVARYYAFGIFKGEDHPYHKTYLRKHNPLQAITYLLVKTVIFPAIWISGIAYLLVSFGMAEFSVSTGFIAVVHTIAAIAIVIFVIAHVYLLTTGHSFVEHVKPMITGYDDVDLDNEELAYLKKHEPDRIK